MNNRRARRAGWGLAAATLWLAACPAPPGPPADVATDLGHDGSADVGTCQRAADCDDGRYCNGLELCAPGQPSSDARGCVPGPAPCAADAQCEESTDECVGASCSTPDQDGDGASSLACGGMDCDDHDPQRFPGATERCDTEGVDEDCNPCTVGNATTRDGDRDLDGFPSTACINLFEGTPPTCAGNTVFVQPNAGMVRGTDCDDSAASVQPTAVEVCNDRDDNCDGVVDEGVQTVFYLDMDGDNYGVDDPGTNRSACRAPADYASRAGDCSDRAAMRNPGAPEVCDGVDNDCDGTVDEDVQGRYYRDLDGDGYGSADLGMSVLACTMPVGYSPNNRDCDDQVAARNPAAVEICDNLDNDCNGQADNGSSVTYYRDRDGDGDGTNDPTVPTVSGCSPPAGYAGNNRDCNDDAAAANSSAPEICDGLDNDCDGLTDEGTKQTFYRDQDRDGFGTPSMTLEACSQPMGYSANAHDCNDGDALVNPSALEICDSVDNDCDGSRDELGAERSCGGPSALNATWMCSAGRCAIASCTGGYGDCDSNTANGCEVNLASAADDCGVCNRSCGLGGSCTAGACDAVVKLTLGDDHGCALRSSGTLLCWGLNNSGQLGLGDLDTRLSPVVVSGVHATDVSAGLSHTCVVQGGVVRCAGANDVGQIGDGSTVSPRTNFVMTAGCSGAACARSLSAGGRYTCGLKDLPGTSSDGRPHCWGQNGLKQVDASGTNQSSPVQVTTTQFAQVATGTVHTCGVSQSGQAYCWGSRVGYQLGDGQDTGSSGVTAVCRSVGVACVGFSGVAEVRPSTLLGFTCARKTDGTVWCWGVGANGQLGTGGTGTEPFPVQVPGLTDVVQLATGGGHSCALKSDGSVWCWGINNSGQLGDGTSTERRSPVRVRRTNLLYLTGITQIAARGHHTCALASSGSVYCWGSNNNGALGLGDTSTRYYPTRVAGF